MLKILAPKHKSQTFINEAMAKRILTHIKSAGSAYLSSSLSLKFIPQGVLTPCTNQLLVFKLKTSNLGPPTTNFIESELKISHSFISSKILLE